MKVKEAGFRSVYHRFVFLEGVEGIKDADALLGYGFIDPDQGLAIEVLGTLVGSTILDLEYEDTFCLPYILFKDAEVKEAEGPEDLHAHYKKKLKELDAYKASAELESIRRLEVLDPLRFPDHPDVFPVCLFRLGHEVEVIPTMVISANVLGFRGKLLLEPKQDFGCHKDENILFQVQKNQEDRMVCISDQTSRVEFTADELKGGALLANTLKVLKKDPSQQTLLILLQILRDSYVLRPKVDGETELLENHENVLFLPVFSSAAEVGEYSDCEEIHMLDVLDLAKEEDVRGIVIDPFSASSYVLPSELFKCVQDLDSSIRMN